MKIHSEASVIKIAPSGQRTDTCTSVRGEASGCQGPRASSGTGSGPAAQGGVFVKWCQGRALSQEETSQIPAAYQHADRLRMD